MNELLAEIPESVTAFRTWARRAVAAIEPMISADVMADFDSETHADLARLVRQAKGHAYRRGLYGLANRLPESRFKTVLDALLRLRECAEWREALPTNEGQVLTVLQAADALGISERTARDLIASGELGHHRVGSGRGRIRIRPRDVEAYQSRTEAGFSHLFR